jgi:DDE superfamily endonuclease/Transposase
MGFSVRKIGNILNHPKSTIQNIIKAYKNSELGKVSSRSGRPTIMTERDNHHLIRVLNKNRRTNIRELCEDFISSTSTNVNPTTLRRHLHKNNIYGRIAVKKPFINAANKMKRLHWAIPKKDWVDEWNYIIWSDESRFEVFRGDGKRYVWRNSQEKYDPKCLTPTFKSGQESVMVWGCFTKYKLGPLVRLEGKITAAVYIEILKDNLIPFINNLTDKDKYSFQEDNAPIHTAKIAKKWKENNNIKTLSWPAQSPDLNPIENLWHELDRKVRSHKLLPKNKDELWQILQEEWYKLEKEIYKNLVNSMPHRIAAVIESKGNPTKY